MHTPWKHKNVLLPTPATSNTEPFGPPTFDNAVYLRLTPFAFRHVVLAQTTAGHTLTDPTKYTPSAHV